jgi:hypothetical protein
LWEQQRRKQLSQQRPQQLGYQHRQPSLHPYHRRGRLPLVKTNPLPNLPSAPVKVRREQGGCARVVGLVITLFVLAICVSGAVHFLA